MARTVPDYTKATPLEAARAVGELLSRGAFGLEVSGGSIEEMVDGSFLWRPNSGGPWVVSLDLSQPVGFAAIKPVLGEAWEQLKDVKPKTFCYVCTTPQGGSILHQATEEAARLKIPTFCMIEGEGLRKAFVEHPDVCQEAFGYVLDVPKQRKADIKETAPKKLWSRLKDWLQRGETYK